MWAHIRARARLQFGCALVVLIAAGLVGLEYLYGRSLGIDTWLLFSRDYQAGVFPGRLPPNGVFLKLTGFDREDLRRGA